MAQTIAKNALKLADSVQKNAGRCDLLYLNEGQNSF
jgi:hypothetical protein